MERFRSSESSSEQPNREPHGAENIYEKIEKITEIDEQTKFKIFEAGDIAELFSILTQLLEKKAIKSNQQLNEILKTLAEEISEYDDGEDIETAQVMQKGLHFLKNYSYFGGFENLDQVFDILRSRWRKLKSELNKKGIGF